MWQTKAILHYKKHEKFNWPACFRPIYPHGYHWEYYPQERFMHEIKRYEKHVKKNSSHTGCFLSYYGGFFPVSMKKHHKHWYQFGGFLQPGKYPIHMDDENAFNLGLLGTTEPFVNANMKELITTGYMSNRGRQVVASYLVHNLGQDWRLGCRGV